MATTYAPVATTTVSGSSTTQITFNSISASYSDLILVYRGKLNSQNNFYIQFNSDTGSNYRLERMYSNPPSSASGSSFDNSLTYIYPNTSAMTNDAMLWLNINQYSNTNGTKPVLFRWSDPTQTSGYLSNSFATWNSTAAISRIDIYATGGSNYFVAGTTITLYQITAA